MDNKMIHENIKDKIFIFRGHRVMIDRDLAELYGVETKYLNRQVKRNRERFPSQFMFQLNAREKAELVTICHRLESLKHSSALPYAFTEHGVAMLASVLRSERAVKISIHIIDVFIKLREYISAQKEILLKLRSLEQRVGVHDQEIQAILNAIRQLMAPPPEKKKEPIGFRLNKKE